jgi:hypothetical protein
MADARLKNDDSRETPVTAKSAFFFVFSYFVYFSCFSTHVLFSAIFFAKDLKTIIFHRFPCVLLGYSKLYGNLMSDQKNQDTKDDYDKAKADLAEDEEYLVAIKPSVSNPAPVPGTKARCVYASR